MRFFYWFGAGIELGTGTRNPSFDDSDSPEDVFSIPVPQEQVYPVGASGPDPESDPEPSMLEILGRNLENPFNRFISDTASYFLFIGILGLVLINPNDTPS